MSVERALWAAILVVAGWGLIGCGDDADSMPPDAAATDGEPPADGSTECARDCDDGVFCNGAELCDPSAPEADDDGCTTAEPVDCDDDIACTTDACDEATAACTNVGPDTDSDGHTDAACLGADGTPAGDDCDDSSAARYPGAAETCDTMDEDCDSTTFGTTDADGDTYVSAECCNPTSSGTACGDDCNDASAGVHPDEAELCNGIDDDCDGAIDDDSMVTFYRDEDFDGYGRSDVTVVACLPAPSGYSDVAGDCDDVDAGRHPGATETCDGIDNDCDVGIDEGAVMEFWVDDDADGYGEAGSMPRRACSRPAGYADNDFDCDDTSAAASPVGTEECDTLDNDCDAAVDEGVMTTAYRDMDSDGYGNTASPTTTMGCTAPPGYSITGGDCHDTDPLIYPGAPERCNRIDDDCGLPGLMAGGTDTAEDVDDDGHSPPTAMCATGFPRDDCDDTRAVTHPGASELCDRIDNNCSLPGGAAGGTDAAEDADADGHAGSAAACTGGPLPRDDCRDATATIYPGAPEACNRTDDNCSLAGAMAGGVDAAEDADSDGHAPTAATCTGGPLVRDDCNDTRATTYPGAPEVCNGFDDNCSSGGGALAAEDADGDSHSPLAAACSGGPFPRDDCDDSRMATHPGAPETCNGIDDDCAGGIDEPAEADAACGAMLACVEATCTPIIGIAAGTRHVCGRTSASAAECWGDGFYGQIGDGMLVTRGGPVPVTGLADAIQISSGDLHSCALRRTGVVSCWGDNGSGRLGDGSTTRRPAPVPVSGITDAIHVSAGTAHSCAVHASGTVSCWGSNTAGQLGNGTMTGSTTPVPVMGLTGAVQVSTGSTHSCARLAAGTVRCWGSNTAGQLGNGTMTSSTTPVATSVLTDAIWLSTGAGGTETCAVRATGSVSCWGALGRTTPGALPVIADATRVEVGTAHGCALRATGGAYCWGTNAYGRLGDGTVTYRGNAVPVSGLAGAVDISAGRNTSCALLSSGAAVCWGSDNFEQLGDGLGGPTTTPSLIPGLTSATRGDAAMHVCVRRSTGEVRCWGRNDNGRLGDGTLNQTHVPVVVPGLSATSTRVGEESSCAIRTAGGASCWGDDFGLAPVDVGVANAVQIDAGSCGGSDFTCAVRSTNTVACWGNNLRGQLGDGTTMDRLTPGPVTGITDATDITVSMSRNGCFGCALRMTGGVSCWGYNGAGELGDGTTIERHTPVAVSGLANAVQISAGDLHACAVRSTGAIACWGEGVGGCLGDGVGTMSTMPVAVTGIMNATQVSAGYSHTCARLSTGAVMCWGRNESGQLGNGTRTDALVPVSVTGITDATSVMAGYEVSCAIHATGAVSCWGDNNYGQAGRSYGLTPVSVMSFP